MHCVEKYSWVCQANAKWRFCGTAGRLTMAKGKLWNITSEGQKTYINTKAINMAWGFIKCSTLGKFYSACGTTALHTDVIRVLQGKLEGCTVNSQGVILNHTTYYLNSDAHI